MAQRQPMNLLDLPVDVLALILAQLVKFDTVIELCACSNHAELSDQLEAARLVLLVHPHLHAIACPMLYSLNTFKMSIVSGRHGAPQAKMLQTYYHSDVSGRARTEPGLFADLTDVPDSPAAEERREMGKLQLFVTPSARRRIRTFVLEVGRHRGWIDQIVTPVLSDMILAGNLASLSITLLYQHPDVRPRNFFRTTSPNASVLPSVGDPAIFTKPPLNGFFRVLADPDLETSQLFLSRRHPPAWCKYHSRDLHCDHQGGKGPSTAAVDWQAIVREVLDPKGDKTAAAWSEASPHLGRT
ncbi:hypothetical protein LLEC1_05259 [Akanthomyces lecanii]|uniref:Uncharacterized protein n=1 Tax=Cordyceps confragosa TaxID=2714763 RepID=A0A179I8A8_CORDF|nr:hypothetical protein LLEC1_05259 [Akanthomyces lecanii]